MFTLQRFSLYLQEFLRSCRPFRQSDILDLFKVRSFAQIEVLTVGKETLVSLVKLRNQFLDIAWVCEATFPFLFNRSENAIWVVELSTLELEHHPGAFSY